MLKMLIEIPRGLKSAIDMGYTNQVITSKIWEATKNGIVVDASGDTISRQAAIKAVHSYNVSVEMSRSIGEYKSEIVDMLNAIHTAQEKAISDLPSNQPKASIGWTPVSEKLPPKFSDVVVWYKQHFSDEEFYGLGYLKENGKWDVDGKSRREVLAWMPLPKPYKESDERR